jgi:hypothetical protein
VWKCPLRVYLSRRSVAKADTARAKDCSLTPEMIQHNHGVFDGIYKMDRILGKTTKFAGSVVYHTVAFVVFVVSPKQCARI